MMVTLVWSEGIVNYHQLSCFPLSELNSVSSSWLNGKSRRSIYIFRIFGFALADRSLRVKSTRNPSKKEERKRKGEHTIEILLNSKYCDGGCVLHFVFFGQSVRECIFSLINDI